VLTTVDLTHLAEDEAAQRLRLEEEASAAQSSLHITEGPLLRAVLFDLGAGRGWRLLLVIHHLAVDGVSWRVLLEDLQAGYEQALAGREIELPAATASFRRWSQALVEYASSERLLSQLPYWTEEKRRGAVRLPVDFEGGADTAECEAAIEVELTQEQTRSLLQEVPRAYHTQAQEALAAALALALRRWAGGGGLLVDFEGHGREEEAAGGLDLSRTVGWFTSVYPVLLEVDGGDEAAALKAVKEQLRSVPAKGVGYGVLRYLSSDERVRSALAEMPAAEVSFNYLGQFDQVLGGGGGFRAAVEPVGAARDSGGRREHPLAVNGMVVGGRLRVSFGYSREVHRREMIEAVAGWFAEALEGLIEHCRGEGVGGHTPSDFPLAGLDQESLDSLLQEFGAA
jgi:non-ribosomal peptide synthase protein (TIGR01720 family)